MSVLQVCGADIPVRRRRGTSLWGGHSCAPPPTDRYVRATIAGAILTRSPDDRNRLERVVSRARKLLAEDFAATAEGRFGLHASGRIQEEPAL
jgi:hypothetical protein